MSDEQNITEIPVPKLVQPEGILRICDFTCSNEEVKTCTKCKRFYCTAHSSRFSPNFCQDCFKQLSVIIDKFEKRVEDYDVKTNTISSTRSSCRQISIDGPDWVFYTAWIEQFTEDELKNIFEFHYFMVKMIEAENDSRKIRAAAKIREMPLPHIKRKSSRTIKTQKVTTVVDVRADLKKQFPKLSDSMIEDMIKVMAGG